MEFNEWIMYFKILERGEMREKGGEAKDEVGVGIRGK